MSWGEGVQSCFQPGDPVAVSRRFPHTGHIRTPFYIRGKRGVVERICGVYRNPEDLAFGRDGMPKRVLYRVRFKQGLVWPDYRGAAGDTVDVEIFEHWLEPPAQP